MLATSAFNPFIKGLSYQYQLDDLYLTIFKQL